LSNKQKPKEKQEHLGTRDEFAALLYVLLLVAHLLSKWREVERCLRKAGTSSTPKKVRNLGFGTQS
jgi:hypothetical protein